MLITQILLDLIYVFIIASMLSIGLGLSLKDIIDSFKRPGMLTHSLLFNLVIIPIVAIGVASVFRLDGAVLIGFLIMACAPGASYAPRITEAANGDIGHSTGLMFLLCTIAVFSAPLTLIIVMPGSGGIDPWPVIKTLALIQMVPLFFGMFLRSYRPEFAHRLSGPAFWTSNISALIVIVMSLLIIFLQESNGGFFSYVFGTCGIPAILIVVVISVMLGYFYGGETFGEKKSMAISSANRNAGVAFLIAVSSFSMMPVAIIMIIIYIIIQSIITGGLAGYWLRKDYKAGKKTILSEYKLKSG
ncbi:MAG: bile acid:sodium symporter [Methanomicrobiaceae archaeon]|nr:bile acid:sodium symporter [Methanomicrobiaceae archaeon]